MRRRWLVVYSAAFCLIPAGLALLIHYFEDPAGKYITCVVVSVVCIWSIGVCWLLFRKKLSLPRLQPKLLWYGSMSTISMVGCWVATALPLAFDVYLPVSSPWMRYRMKAYFGDCLFLQPTGRAGLVRLPLVAKIGARRGQRECFGTGVAKSAHRGFGGPDGAAHGG